MSSNSQINSLFSHDYYCYISICVCVHKYIVTAFWVSSYLCAYDLRAANGLLSTQWGAYPWEMLSTSQQLEVWPNETFPFLVNTPIDAFQIYLCSNFYTRVFPCRFPSTLALMILPPHFHNVFWITDVRGKMEIYPMAMRPPWSWGLCIASGCGFL